VADSSALLCSVLLLLVPALCRAEGDVDQARLNAANSKPQNRDRYRHRSPRRQTQKSPRKRLDPKAEPASVGRMQHG
jgi:hypothetical protein